MSPDADQSRAAIAGLTAPEAEARLDRFGPNEPAATQRHSVLSNLLHVFMNPRPRYDGGQHARREPGIYQPDFLLVTAVCLKSRRCHRFWPRQPMPATPHASRASHPVATATQPSCPGVRDGVG